MKRRARAPDPKATVGAILAGLLLTGALVGCGASGTTPVAGPTGSVPAASLASTAVPRSASPAPSSGALPTPDIVFKAEVCPSDAACRHVAVARISGIPFTTAIPCHDDGTTCVLTLDLYYPATPAAAGTTYPIAAVERGGPDVPGTEGIVAPLLAGQGVVVVDGAWRQSTAYGGGGAVGLRDIACTILAARTLGQQVGGEPGRVTLIGHSLGAWAASVLALTPDPPAPDAGQCLFAGGDGSPDAFAGLAGPYLAIQSASDDESWEPIVGAAREADPTAWAALDPMALVDRYGAPDIPILLMHGDPDGIVPPAESEALAAALTAAGLQTTAVVEPGVDHAGIRLEPATIRALVELLQAG